MRRHSTERRTSASSGPVSSRPEMRSGSGRAARRSARGTSQPIARSGVASSAPVRSEASEPIERRPQIRASRSPRAVGRCAVAARKQAWMAPTEAPVMMSKRGGLPEAERQLLQQVAQHAGLVGAARATSREHERPPRSVQLSRRPSLGTSAAPDRGRARVRRVMLAAKEAR